MPVTKRTIKPEAKRRTTKKSSKSDRTLREIRKNTGLPIKTKEQKQALSELVKEFGADTIVEATDSYRIHKPLIEALTAVRPADLANIASLMRACSTIVSDEAGQRFLRGVGASAISAFRVVAGAELANQTVKKVRVIGDLLGERLVRMYAELLLELTGNKTETKAEDEKPKETKVQRVELTEPVTEEQLQRLPPRIREGLIEAMRERENCNECKDTRCAINPKYERPTETVQ